MYSPNLRGKQIKIISVRCKNVISIENSLVFEVELSKNDLNCNDLKWIGWEKNEKGKLLPRLAQMASSMDPEKYINSKNNFFVVLIFLF